MWRANPAHSTARQLRTLAFTGFFTALFVVAAANQMRRDDGAIVWVSIAIATYFAMYFAVTLNQLYSRLWGSPYAALPGDLVSVVAEDNEYGVAKVLAIDDEGVHARLYAQRFKQRPAAVDPASLELAAFDTDHSRILSIGHIPLSWATFAAWKPKVIMPGLSVSDDELDGFRLWQEGGGDYF